MGAQRNDVLYAERIGICGKVTVEDILKVGAPNLITINFGVNPINQKSFNIIDANCNATSKIDIDQYFISQTEENFGVQLQLFTECLNGSFNIIAISQEPFSRGIFNIKYNIL